MLQHAWDIRPSAAGLIPLTHRRPNGGWESEIPPDWACAVNEPLTALAQRRPVWRRKTHRGCFIDIQITDLSGRMPVNANAATDGFPRELTRVFSSEKRAPVKKTQRRCRKPVNCICRSGMCARNKRLNGPLRWMRMTRPNENFIVDPVSELTSWV